MPSRFSRQELVQEARWRRYKRDPIAFFEECWYIRHPELGAIKFELFPEQIEALEQFRAEPRVLILKARQLGWTTLVAAYAFWLAYFYPDRAVIVLSRGERQAVDILKMVKYGHKRLPDWLKARGPKLLRDNQEIMPFDNGSEIESLPSKQDPGRGKTAYLVIVDEWAFLENPDEAWASIEPIADVGGRIIALSTANGWGNLFHSMWEGAAHGGNGFTRLFYPWSARSDRDDEWYERQKKKLPEWQLHQEYPSNPDEAFIRSGNPVFDVEYLATIEPEPGRRGYLTRDGGRVTFVPSDLGELTVWELPKDFEGYVVGADTAEGLEHGDFSSAHVIGLRSGKVVAHWHGHIPPDEFADVLQLIGEFYWRALVAPEANNHGISTCLKLKEAKYPNIYYQWTYDEKTKRKSKKLGWHTTRTTKPLMIDELHTQLRASGELVLLDAPTIVECRTYVRDERGQMHGSPFDDRVVSLAIANQMRKHAKAPEFRKTYDDYWTLGWWAKQGREREGKPGTIGSHNIRKSA